MEAIIQGQTYTLGCLYAPTQDKPQEQIRFLNDMERYLELLSESIIILGGDFNCILNPTLDKNQSPSQSNGVNLYRDRIKALLEDKGLCDIWRRLHLEGRGFTFRRVSYASRLDYVFVPEHLSGLVAQTRIH